jgi:hypothetical protein
MDVILRHVRQFVIDDERHVLDVETARGDVGGDEDLQLAVLERREGFETCRLVLSPWIAEVARPSFSS